MTVGGQFSLCDISAYLTNRGTDFSLCQTIFSSMSVYVTALKGTGSSYTQQRAGLFTSSIIKCLLLEQRAGMLTARDKRLRLSTLRVSVP